MSDVRSLLRNELASRKGSSPNTAGNRISKKRKVDNGDGVMRKKLRSTDLETVQAAANAQDVESPSAEGAASDEVLNDREEQNTAGPEPPLQIHQQTTLPLGQPTPSAPAMQASNTVDEDEWAAFEREVAEPSRAPQVPAALAANATVSAAPLTNEELAALGQRQTASTVRAREAELEGEREDAARFMEDEFDEMEQLEQRVRKLKQMREELRHKRAQDESRDQLMVLDEQQEAEESDSDEDEDEEWDDWRFK
ncbi:hypothetical protein N7532_008742 [Penicillium argentinense]|uniref:Uncharacterized protein n=1 Tax=Penicillium argentinense TaxID=1131581 RepID=A0A9W9K1Y5_9EURO|nr:uncharacterized protein N7532_008742 [Penicillium argentinense]KAJ5090058.1 hypothetical protein N7532_008742 [Penicillium argentinense]